MKQLIFRLFRILIAIYFSIIVYGLFTTPHQESESSFVFIVIINILIVLYMLSYSAINKYFK